MSKVAIVGGGPAGIMAAIFASQNGAEVTLFEKNEKLGKKIYITGKGRCNVTNDCDPKEFLSNVVTNASFLYSASYKWTSRDTMDLLEQNGLKLKVERGNRVFPESDKASDVTKTLEKLLHRNGVKICLNSEILRVECLENSVKLYTITDIVVFDKVIIATGGLSYPTTGSTGDGFRFAKSIGHNVVDAKAALCEIPLHQDVSSLEGLSLKNVVLSAKNNKTGKELCSFFGEMLFTKNGISGPIALSTSSVINKYPLDQVALYLDLKPGLKNEHGQQPNLDERLLKDFKEFTNKEFKNSLVKLFPDRLCQYVAAQSKIPLDKQVNRVS
ncbi:MAG: aminoacetone oxidase family FAD-binding enzyme, partial [Clostridia bacterium]|nr:aminoacetone oxidase family FAD-binding enzyme [Clostridia bacterium]